MGIERLLALWREQGHQHEVVSPDAYLVHQGEAAGRFAFRVAEAPLALIIGDDEAAANAVGVKQLRGGFDQPPPQLTVGFDELADQLGILLFPMEDDDGSL